MRNLDFKRRGSALITLVVVGGFLLFLVGVTYTLTTRMLEVQRAVRMAAVVYQGAEGGLEVVMHPDSIRKVAEEGDTVRASHVVKGIRMEGETLPLVLVPVPGGSLRFAEEYEGIGIDIGKGGLAQYVLGLSQARALLSRAGMEGLYLHILGLP